MALLDKGGDINVTAPKAQENNQYMGFLCAFYYFSFWLFTGKRGRNVRYKKGGTNYKKT